MLSIQLPIKPIKPPALCLACLLMFLFSNGHTNECETMSVSGSNQWRPIAYSKGDNTVAQGIAYDVLKELSAALKLPININVKLPWARAMKMLDDGELDMMAGVYWTEQRSRQYLFSKAITNDTLNIFVKRGKEFNYQKFEDLAGKHLDLLRGSSLGNEFDQYIQKNLKLSEVNTFSQQMARLNVGRSDIVVLDPFTAGEALRELKLSSEIVMLENPIAVNPVHLIFSKTSPCAIYLDKINKLIDEMDSNGRLDDIRSQYL
jgi:polar amino acid transport system substrate-binding protein